MRGASLHVVNFISSVLLCIMLSLNTKGILHLIEPSPCQMVVQLWLLELRGGENLLHSLLDFQRYVFSFIGVLFVT
ncbi:hypothetical protein SUGI_1002360 [Cryptomeria japonica]|nr:hypothetical protein SUGI_1002360 [Cryptomeria japonica]